MGENDKTLLELGEIKGILTGLHRLIEQQAQSTNTRIDDLRTAITARLDNQQADIAAIRDSVAALRGEVQAHDEAIESIKAQAIRSGGLSGAGVGALIAGGVELAKAFLK